MFNPAPLTLDPSAVPSRHQTASHAPNSPQGLEVSCGEVVTTSRDACEGSIYCNLACHEHIIYCYRREQETETVKKKVYLAPLNTVFQQLVFTDI